MAQLCTEKELRCALSRRTECVDGIMSNALACPQVEEAAHLPRDHDSEQWRHHKLRVVLLQPDPDRLVAHFDGRGLHVPITPQLKQALFITIQGFLLR